MRLSEIRKPGLGVAGDMVEELGWKPPFSVSIPDRAYDGELGI